MLIKSLQKTTLIDYPGKIACTLFLYGCNFKCEFCHNPELVIIPSKKTRTLREEEVLEFLNRRTDLLEGVCITGGEPLLNIDINFLKIIKKMGYHIKIDTNGSFPEKLKEIIDLNLVDYIAMDLKSSKEMYEKIVNSKVFIEKIEQSIKLIHDFGNYEFRTTIIEKFHTDEEIEKMLSWVNGIIDSKIKNYYLQGFRNTGKLVGNKFNLESDSDIIYLIKLKKVSESFCDNVEVRN